MELKNNNKKQSILRLSRRLSGKLCAAQARWAGGFRSPAAIQVSGGYGGSPVIAALLRQRQESLKQAN